MDDVGERTLSPGTEAFFELCIKGDVQAVRGALASGTDPNMRDERGAAQRTWPAEPGGTPLMYAAERGHVEVVRALLDAGRT